MTPLEASLIVSSCPRSLFHLAWYLYVSPVVAALTSRRCAKLNYMYLGTFKRNTHARRA
jgi:hypothetical protein